VARIDANTRPRAHWNVLVSQVEWIVISGHVVAALWNVPSKYVREPDWYAMRQRWKLAAKRIVLLARACQPASQKFCLREQG
jgi:hypothetical protein